jgi:HEPN domain-containing protein
VGRGDFATVEREVRARKNPNYDGVCFHAQQCAEKYLKALAHLPPRYPYRAGPADIGES